MLQRHKSTEEGPSSSNPESHTNLRYLKTPTRKIRFQQLRQKRNVCNTRVKRMKEKLERWAEERGIEVERDLHDVLVMTMEDNDTQIGSQYAPGTFQRIFWDQQYKGMKVKNAASMRWEPAMIRYVCVLPE